MSHLPAADAPDIELVRRAAAGEREAFAAIYVRYRAPVFRFARLMTGSATIAEDVTQEAFVILMRGLQHYDGQRAGLATYLYGVARNLTRNRLRRDRRLVTLDAATADETIGPDDPFAAAARSQRITQLRRIIVALPSRYREVVILYDVHGLSYAETADALAIPVGTVRSRLSRGRELIAARMHEATGAGAGAVHAQTARCLV